MDMNNLPDKDFKMLVIMFMESRRIMEGYNEKFNKEIENIRKFQTELTELKNTITELKNTLKDIYSKLDNAESWISHLEDKVVDITQIEQQKEKKGFLKSKDSLRELWDIKYTNLIIRVLGEERDKGGKDIFEEIMAEKFYNLRKET